MVRLSGNATSRKMPFFRASLVSIVLLFSAIPLYGQIEYPKVEIVGGGEIDSTRLREAAGEELRALRAGEGDAATAADAAYNIESWLRREGYPEARVHSRMIRETPAGDLRVRSSEAWESVTRLELIVEPGRRVLLGEITFNGVEAFSERRLRSLFPRGVDLPFQREEIEEALGRAARLYEVNGYARSSLGPIETDSREAEDATYYDVSVPVDEGPRFRIDEIDVRSGQLKAEELRTLEELIRLQGRPYFPRQETRGAITIREHLGAEGYEAKVDHTAELSPSGEVRLVYFVDPGPKLLLEEVVVSNRGAEPLRTRRSFVRSFLPLKPGDPVDLTALEETENRLYSLGIFALAEVGIPEREDGEAEERDPREETAPETRETSVQVALEELRSRYLELTAGWGSYEQLRGSLTYTDRNLFGRGRSWTASLEGSFKSYGVEMSVSDNVLLGPSSTAALTGSYRYRDAVAYDRRQGRAEASVTYRLSRLWTVRTSYTFARSVVTEVEGEIPGIEDADLATGSVQVAGEYDSRDSVVTPERGGYLLLAPLLSAPVIGSELSFTGGEIATVRHFPFAERFVLSLSGRYRVRRRIGSEDPLPIQERFFLGGADSVRSFSQDSMGLLNSDGVPQGGMSALEGTAELRIRIVEELHTALFYDFGQLGRRAFAFSGDQGHAVGAGVRYYLPVGPIRLDFAYNPGKRYEAEHPWALHFAVGFSY
ncbi:MAG: BamA/OMP85 family outer membrane protein [Alkalispirochaetaceae bacterium]